MRYIIHVGLHKTGTTTLQKTLSENKNLLLQLGIDYFEESLRIPSGNGLGHLVLREGVLADFQMQAGRKNKLLDKLHTFLCGANEIKLISGESLSLIRTLEEVERLVELIGTRNIEIIVTLRRKDHWWKSYRQQILKTGIRSVKPLSAANLKNKEWLLDHERLVQVFKRTVGNKNVHILNYSKSINYEIMKIINPEAEIAFEKNYNVTGHRAFGFHFFYNTKFGLFLSKFYRIFLRDTLVGKKYRKIKEIIWKYYND